MSEINRLIAEKTALDQKLQDTRLLLNRCEGYLKEREDFKRLEDLVARLQGYILVNRQGAAGFSEEEKMIVRELFGIRPGSGNPEDLRQRLRDELLLHKETIETLIPAKSDMDQEKRRQLESEL